MKKKKKYNLKLKMRLIYLQETLSEILKTKVAV